MFSYPAPGAPHPLPSPLRQADGASGNLDAPPVDSETAALFRAALCPLISQSVSWPALMDILRDKGYGLAFRGGRLFLTNLSTGTRVCSLRFLGMPLRDLVARLGRPNVRALPGHQADGELLRTPPAPRKS